MNKDRIIKERSFLTLILKDGDTVHCATQIQADNLAKFCEKRGISINTTVSDYKICGREIGIVIVDEKNPTL
jgi:hypothetical protein